MEENYPIISEIRQTSETLNELIASLNYWNKKLKQAIEKKDIKTIFKSFFELHFISTTTLNLSKEEMIKIKEYQINKKSLTNK